MKPLTTILLLVLLTNYGVVYSQSANPERQSVTAGKIRLDSILSFQYNSTAKEVLPSEKSVYTYHNTGELALEVLWKFGRNYSTGNDELVPLTKSAYQYENAQMTEKISATYLNPGIGWRNQERYTWQYNDKGKPVNNQSFKWGYYLPVPDWINHEKTINGYDAAGNVILTEKYAWNTTAEEWRLQQKEEMEYNPQGARIQYILSSADFSTGKLVLKSKEVAATDTAGNILENNVFRWHLETETWQESNRYEYRFNSQGKKIYEATFNYETANSGWKKVIENEYEFNDAGLNTLYRRLHWYPDSNALLIYTIDKRAYDNTGFMTSRTRYQRNNTTNVLEGQIRQFSEKNPQDNSITTTSDSWNKSTLQFVRDVRTVDFPATEGTATIYTYYWNNDSSDYVLTYRDKTSFDEKMNVVHISKSQLNKTGGWEEYSYTQNEFDISTGGEQIIRPDALKQKLPYKLLSEEFASNMFMKVYTLKTYHYSPFGYSPVMLALVPQVRIYPNPASDFVCIEGVSIYEDSSLELFDMNGRLRTVTRLNGSPVVRLNGLESGIYIYRFKSEGHTVTGKLHVHR